MQETWVQSLIWEDPTCHGVTKPVYHNYWAGVCCHCGSLCTWSPCSAAREATQREASAPKLESCPCSPKLEKACTQPQRPSTTKLIKLKKRERARLCLLMQGGSIPGQATKIPHASGPKKKKTHRSNIITNSRKSLKMVHIKKKSWKKSWRLRYENHLLTFGLKAKGDVCFPVGHFCMLLISRGACFHCSVLKVRELTLWPTVVGIKSFQYARFLWVAFKPLIPVLETRPFFRSIA